MVIHGSRLGYVGLLTLLSLTNACSDAGTPGAPREEQPSTLPQATAQSLRLEGLRFPAQVATDADGVPHIFAATESDLMFVQGYVTARDRLFQMDVSRRQAEGTLAELLGEGALQSDAQLRTFGLRRAAERSVEAASPEVRAALTSYAAGVNAYVRTNPLPPEYAALEITQVRPWGPADSVSVIKLVGFALSFDITDIDQTLTLNAYQAAGHAQGFDGAALFLRDTNRVAPFDPASTIPDALARPVRSPGSLEATPAIRSQRLPAATLGLARKFLNGLSEAPFAKAVTRSGGGGLGTNLWVVSGRLSATGQPLLANDPHLPASSPATFYHQQLVAPAAGIDVIGPSLPGAPYVVLGNNQRVAWTASTNYLDVTDAYQERIVADPASPSQLSTVYKGALEPVVALPQTFRFNVPGDGVTDELRVEPPGARVPAAVLIVPRRNQGPIVQLDRAAGVAISIQYAGASGTRELDAFRGFVRARDLKDFERALQFFDVPALNFACADENGDIAYFLGGEVPLREDLQAGKIAGLPPTFVRNGQGGNEWLEPSGPDPLRALPFEILPAREMPRLINPPRGFIVSANNDPTGDTLDNDPFNERRPGGGILYLGTGYALGVRAGRITELLDERIARRGRVSLSDMKEIQADTVMNEARYFTPFILGAFDTAQKPSAHSALRQAAADPRVTEAVARLRAWDGSSPTGLRQGFDKNDRPGNLREPSAEEIQHSVAATIYSVWRNEFSSNVVVRTLKRRGLPFFNTTRDDVGEVMTTLRNLLDNFEQRRGIGASGIDFFEVPGIDDPAARRDLIVLRSLASALDRLAGDGYEAAFKRSTNQNDYRWGRLHRVVLTHPLGGRFSTPPAFDAFRASLADLPGIPVDGGLWTVDVANNLLVLDDSPNPMDAFLVRTVPTQRYVARLRSFGAGFDAENVLAGGQSAVPGSPFYQNLLERWLTNETYPFRQNLTELAGSIATLESLRPVRP